MSLERSYGQPMGDITLTIPDDRSLDGPAMSCLTEPQRAFVLALGAVPPRDGKPDHRRAALAAGLNEQYGLHLLRNPRVAAAIQEEVNKRFGPAALLAVQGIESLAGDKTHKDHFGALKWLAAMAGMAPEQKVSVAHSGAIDHNLIPVDNRERVMRIAERLKALGKDPRPVLEAAGIKLDGIIDAEFTEVWEVDV